MKIIQRLKEYFSKKEYYSCDGYEFENPSLSFKILDTEKLLDLSKYISHYLEISESIADKKNNLIQKFAIECDNLDELLNHIKDNVDTDYGETLSEAKEANWEFEYFTNTYFLNKQTLCVYNRLSYKNGKGGNMTYPVLSIRRQNDKFYFWSHLDGFQASTANSTFIK